MPGPRTESGLAILLAGGEGRRLKPLTDRTPKPLVSFGTTHRIIDFALANLSAAGFLSVYIPGPEHLIDNLDAWKRCWERSGGTLAALPPPSGRYSGTGDAVVSMKAILKMQASGIVAVLPSDQVYGCVLPDLVDFHRGRGNAVTLAVARVPVVEAAQLGVVTVADSGRLSTYHEKPNPADVTDDTATCLVSTGIFLFEIGALVDRLEGWPAVAETDWDLSPGLFPPEDLVVFKIGDYWRDAGTVGAYWRAHMDLLESPSVLDQTDREWPGPPSAIRPVLHRAGTSLLGPRFSSCPGGVRRSILADDVVVGEGATVEDCILLSGVRVGSGARLVRVIVDGPNDVPAGFHLNGADDGAGDAWPRDPGGVVVVPAGTFPGV